MKTLAEVIKNLEDGTEHLSAMLISMETWSDALHYLKEYQRLQIAFLKALADLEDNPPLDWDDLKQMEGKPVWVEYTYQGEWRSDKGEWIIINLMGDDDLIDQTGEGLFPKSLYGKTWQAYRKERE